MAGGGGVWGVGQAQWWGGGGVLKKKHESFTMGFEGFRGVYEASAGFVSFALGDFWGAGS